MGLWMDAREVAGEDMRGLKVGDLVRFKSIDDILGLMNESIGLIHDVNDPSTVRVHWLTGLMSGRTTSTFPFQLEKIDIAKGEVQ